MTPKQLADYIRLNTKTDSTSLPDSDLLTWINIEKDNIAKEITRANEDYFVLKHKRNLESGKRNYKMPSELLNNMKFLTAKLDGSNYVRLKEYDVNTLGIRSLSNDDIKDFFSKNSDDYQSGFTILGGEIIILNDDDIDDVEDGLILYATIFPADITDLSSTTDMSEDPSSTSFGFPRQFHKILADRVCRTIKQRPGSKMALNEDEKNVDLFLEQAINAIKGQNLDRSVQASIPYDDGQDY